MRRGILLSLFLMAGFASGVCPGRAMAQPFQNVKLSDPSQYAPNEVSVTINPKNSSEVAGGSNIWYLYTSQNGGSDWRWKQVDTTSRYGFWGDPCLMYDDSGILYYEHLSGHNWQDSEFLWRVVVQRSLDNGVTWDSGEQIGLYPPTEQDKAWLGLDRSQTSSNGTLMTSWNEDDKYGSYLPKDSSRIFFSKSTDHGESWSDRVRVDHWGGDCVDSSNTVEGAVTATLPNGTICIVWSGHNKIYFNKSTDGGKSFGQEKAIADQPYGWCFVIPGIFRANGFPMIVSDENPKSEYYGRLYVMWSDQRRRAPDGAGITDIYSIYSDDSGNTWSKMVRVNTDTAMNHHFFPNMSLDPVTGHLFLTFYDRRHYLDSETDVYLARSTDGGASFTNTRISQTAFGPDSGVFFGDYIGVSAYNGKVVPIWMRMDDSAMSVWSGTIQETDAFFNSTDAFSSVAENASTIDEIRSSGSASVPTLDFSTLASGHITIQLFDVLGRSVSTLVDGTYGAGSYRIPVPQSVPNGDYLARMTSSTGISVAKVSIAR